MKKKYCSIVLFFLLVTPQLKPDDYDDLDAFADTIDYQPKQVMVEDITAQFVLDFIAAPPLLFQDRLQNNLYLFTHPINKRSLLDYSFNLLHDYCVPKSTINYSWWIFYNQTLEGNFTKEGTNITSYWNLNNANLIQGLDEFDFDINLPTIIQIAGVMKIQERRAGFMFGIFADHDNWNLEAKIPLYYQERNFFFTDEERLIIKQTLQLDTDVNNDDAKKFVVSDAIGIGDSRISFGSFVFENEGMALNLGVEATVPTAKAFARGLIGSDFAQDSEHAPFNFLQLFQLAFGQVPPATQEIIDISIDFALSVASKLSANLLQTSMGNNGHIGIAPFFEHFIELNELFHVTTRGALEYLFPSCEKRFYITRKFAQEFTSREPYTTEEGADPDQAPEKLAFLNQQFIDTFIPKVFNTSIYPGFILKLTSELSVYGGNNWQFGLGADLWWQDREKLGRIKATPLEISNIRTDIATRPGAYQNKLFGTVNYYKKGRWFDWCLTGYVDYTVIRYGIGKDFTTSLRFSAHW